MKIIIYLLIGVYFGVRNIKTKDYFCKPPPIIEMLFWPAKIGEFVLSMVDKILHTIASWKI